MLDVTPESTNLTSVIVTGVITGIAGFIASRKGGKEGSAGALNGTAVAVRQIKDVVGKIESKLDGHVTQTAENFRALSDNVHGIGERTSNIEGRLAIPQAARRAPRKAALKAAKPKRR